MCYFTESTSLGADGTDYGLHLAVSTDSLNWTPLNQNNPLVTPTEGDLGLRDPFILRKQDGTFVVIATDLKGTDWTYVRAARAPRRLAACTSGRGATAPFPKAPTAPDDPDLALY
jgi:hypothetical protein